MNKQVFFLAALAFAGSCLAQVIGSDFVGSYVAKDRSGAEFEVLRIASKGGKLVATEGETASTPFEVQLASRQEIERFLARLDKPVVADQVSGIKTRDGDSDKIILLRVPVGTLLDREASTTGYVVIGVGAIEVHRR